MIAHRDQDGIVTLEWDDPEEHSVKVDREVMESMVAEINDARRLGRALQPFVTRRENVETVPLNQWLSDCSTLLTAAMYGSPPGGWSDPERCAAFLREMSDIEARMRAATPEIVEESDG